MKLNSKHNIVTSDDIIITNGNQIGKNLSDIIDDHENKINRLASNDKWLYKYGGFGSGTGGGGGSSDNWSIYAAINGQQIKSGNTISLYGATSCKLEVSINKPNAGIFNTTVNYEGKSQRTTLDINNSYSWVVTLPVSSNGIISITVRDGNNTTNSVNCMCVVNPYDFSLSFVNSNGIPYDSTDNDIFINTVSLSGLKIAMKYDIAVDAEISYKTSNTFGITDTNEYITDKTGTIYFTVPDELLTNDNAGYYSFNVIYTIALPNQKPVSVSQSLNCNLIPDGLYLKVLPQNSLASIYSISQIDTYNEYLEIINRIEEIKTDIIENGSTDEKVANLARAEEELADIKNILYTFNKGIVGLMIQIYDGQNLSRSDYYLSAVNTNDSGITDVTMSFSQYTERQYYSVNIIANDNSIGENIIEFTLKHGSSGVPVKFKYFYYINNEGSSLTWYDNTPSADNHYRPQDVTALFSNYANNNFIQMKANMTSNNILFDTNTLPSTVNIIPNIVNDVMISFGIQYSKINNIDNKLITISAGNNLTDNQITIYQNKITLGTNSDISASIYIPKESEYAVDDYSKYHLLTIYKRFIKRYNNNNYYEICIYIDGVFEQAFDSYVSAENAYKSIILNPGNYALNMVEMTYFNNTTPVTDTNNIQGMNDTAITQYWYKYCELYRNRNGYNDTFVKLLSSLKQMHENTDGMIEVANSSVIEDIATNVDVPVILINRRLYDGEDFITWLTQGYDPEVLGEAGRKEVSIQYSGGKSSLTEYSIPVNWGNSSFYIELQGSSTGRYKSKNLNLGISSDSDTYKVLYTPNFKNVTDNMTADEKKTAYASFLPEEKFTLKADIVDSTHNNNTAVGAFVNANTTKFEKYDMAIGNYSNYIKNCLLGFPILLFISLTSNSGEIRYYYLGIYNFNLGRDSHFNMGYIKNSVLNNIERPNAVNGTLEDGFNICAIPTDDCAISDKLTIAEIQGNDTYYDFSQFDDTVLFPLTDAIHQTDNACMFGDFVPSTKTVDKKVLVEGVIKTFVEKVAKSGGYLFESIGKHLDENPDNYEYGYKKSISNTNAKLSANQVPNYKMQYKRSIDNASKNVFTWNGTYLEKSSIYDLIDLIIANEETGTEPALDYRSLVEYYTVCMAFGLVDSVLKNLNIKCWNAKHITEGGNSTFTGKFNIAFYDMDTAFGRTNSGADVVYFAFSDYWVSTITRDTLGNIVPSPITVYRDFYPEINETNKKDIPQGYDIASSYLFAIAKYAQIFVNNDLVKSVTPENLWAQWRRSDGELRNAKYFIDKYFIRNMDEIPEALFNDNYRTKYLVRRESSFDFENNKKGFHGKGINEVTDWLDGRLHILDAYFNLANTQNYIQTLVYDENGNPTVWENMKMLSIKDGQEQYTNINMPQPDVRLIDSTNPDILVLQDIFGGSTAKKYSSTISVSIKALAYSPLIMKFDQQNVKYLFEDPNVQYLITYRPNGSINVLFGGSKLWTYISSINSLIDENGTLTITSNYLENLTGTSGVCNQWAINMPSLRDVSLTSSNYSGNLTFKIDETTSKDSYPNLTSINISGSKIQLNVHKEGVQTINASNVTADNISVIECNDLRSVNLNNSTFETCTIAPVWSDNIQISNASIRTLILSGKEETLSTNKITINNNQIIEELNISNFTDINISNCPNLKRIIIGNPHNITKLKLIGVYTKYENDDKYFELLTNSSEHNTSSVLDLSEFINLKELSLERTKGFKSVNIQSGVKLDSSAFAGTALEYINLYKYDDNTHTVSPDEYNKKDNPDNIDAAGNKYYTYKENCSEGYIILNGNNIFADTKYAMKSAITDINRKNCINRMLIPGNITSLRSMFKYSTYINNQITSSNGLITTDLADAFLHSDYICKYENIENITDISDLFFGQSLKYRPSEWQDDMGTYYKNSSLSLGRFVNVNDISQVFRRNKDVTILCREMFIWHYKDDNVDKYSIMGYNQPSISINNMSINFSYIVENAFYDIVDKLQFFVYNSVSVGGNIMTLIKKDLVDNNISYYGDSGPETIKLWNLFHGVRDNNEIYPSNITAIYCLDFNNSYAGNAITFDFNKLFNSNWNKLETITRSFGYSYPINNFVNVDADNNAVDIENITVTGIGLRNVNTLKNISSGSFRFINSENPIDYYNFVNWNNIYTGNSTGLYIDESCVFTKYITRENLYNLVDIMATNNASILNYTFKNLLIIIDDENDNELKLSDVPAGKLSNVSQAISLFENAGMITTQDFNNGVFNNLIPMHLTHNTMADLVNVTDIRNIFANIIIDSNLPVNFFNKRKSVRNEKQVYCGIQYNYETKQYDFSNYVPARLIYYDYTSNITNITGAFSNIKIYGNTYFDDIDEWNNTYKLVADDGNTYTEYWENLSGNPIQFSNGDLNGSYKYTWSIIDGNTVYFFYNNAIRCGKRNENDVLDDTTKNIMINNVCTHLILPPDILWGCLPTCNCAGVFSGSYFEGIMPCQLLRKVQTSQLLADMFTGLNVIPNKCMTIELEDDNKVERNNIYSFIPKGFISNEVLNNIFTFNLNAPSKSVSSQQIINGIQKTVVEYDSYYVLRDDSIGDNLMLMQNSLPGNQYQISWRANSSIDHRPDSHNINLDIHYNIMININSTLYNYNNTDTEAEDYVERIMSKIIVDGIDCNKFTSFVPTGLVDADTAAILYGHIFKHGTFDAFIYDIAGNNTIPVIVVGNRAGMELSMNAILPDAQSVISKNFIQITGRGSSGGLQSYNSLWDINFEDKRYQNYAALWNTSTSYYVNIFQYAPGTDEHNKMLTWPIGERK